MIITVLNSPRSAASSLNYNQNKVNCGLGDIISTGNIDSVVPFIIRKEILKMETNPDISARARTLGFHAAICPGPGEEMTDETAAAYVKEYMEYIGFGEQPFVIFKHRDIDRVHYHVVSSKVKRDGKMLHNSFTGMKTREFIKETEQKYNVVLGRNPMAPTETVKNIKRFNYTKGNIQQQIDYFYKKALKYKFESPEEFLSVMAAFGVKTWENDKGYLSFQGTDREGNSIGKILKQIDIDRFADIKKAAGKKRSDDEITDCLVAVESCLEVSSSERQFLRELKRAGIDISYDKENGRYTDMRFVDHVHGTVVNLQDFGDRLTAEMVNIMAEQWTDNPAEEMVPGNGRTFVSMPEGEYHTSELHDKLDEISESIKKMFRS